MSPKFQGTQDTGELTQTQSFVRKMSAQIFLISTGSSAERGRDLPKILPEHYARINTQVREREKKVGRNILPEIAL